MIPGEPGSPAHTHRMDQTQALSADVARLWATYHRTMVAEGMTRDEATRVLCTWVAASNLSAALKHWLGGD